MHLGHFGALTEHPAPCSPRRRRPTGAYAGLRDPYGPDDLQRVSKVGVSDRRIRRYSVAMTNAEGFAAYLNAAMRSAKISQADVARAVKVAPSAVSAWLRGAQPSIENLRTLAPLLDVHPMDLYVRAGHILPREAGMDGMPEPPEAPDPVRAIMAQDWLPDETKKAMVTLLGELWTGYGGDNERPARDDRASGR